LLYHIFGHLIFKDPAFLLFSFLFGITRAQLYRYLGRAERVDVPSDEISARIVKAAYKLRPAQTKDFFKFLLKQFRTLISRL